MPSGITYALEEKNFDVQKWLLEDIPRMYGICVTLRDDPNGLSSDEIRKRLIAGSSDLSYYEEKLKEAETNIVAFKKRTKKAWRKEYDSSKKKSKEYFEETLKKKREQKGKFEKALNQIKGIQQRFIRPNSPEVIRGIIAGSIEAIEKSIEWDFGGMQTEFKFESLEEYIKSQLDGAIRDVTYNRQHIMDSKKRDTDRLESFDAYVAFIKSVTSA